MELGGTINNDLYLLSFLAVIHLMMWTLLDLVVWSIEIFRGNLLSETFLDYVFERCNIVFLESGVLGEFTFRETALRSTWHLLAGNAKL